MKERQILDERYVIVRPLGSGPVGILYEAENLLLGKRVGVKWINPAMARRPGVAEKVLAKAKEAAGLDHPNIASVLDLGEIDGAPYIVTEPLSGHTLEREIDQGSSASVAVACDLVLQILSALDYAHANGVLHGALSPSAVLISYPRPGVPWVKVTDFGLFQALEDVHGDGPHPAPAGGYRAPEYGQGGEIDRRADVYSAAALLHSLLHGVPPGAEAESSSHVPGELTEILGRALRSNLRERTDSAQALAAELAPFAQEPSRGVDIRLSSPPSIRFVNSQRPLPQPVSLPITSHGASVVRLSSASNVSPERISEAPFRHAGVTESLLRNPRFPSDKVNSWSKRWRSLRSHLASHPNVGAAWLFALASVGAGIACALLAAWLQ
ncbi:MAG TPA: serine/threonine-protein kinase [Polyangiaceae bacterium]|nr:serine/threonine-protein kinase [Polyangiaceae bacterium]